MLNKSLNIRHKLLRSANYLRKPFLSEHSLFLSGYNSEISRKANSKHLFSPILLNLGLKISTPFILSAANNSNNNQDIHNSDDSPTNNDNEPKDKVYNNYRSLLNANQHFKTDTRNTHKIFDINIDKSIFLCGEVNNDKFIDSAVDKIEEEYKPQVKSLLSYYANDLSKYLNSQIIDNYDQLYEVKNNIRNMKDSLSKTLGTIVKLNEQDLIHIEKEIDSISLTIIANHLNENLIADIDVLLGSELRMMPTNFSKPTFRESINFSNEDTASFLNDIEIMNENLQIIKRTKNFDMNERFDALNQYLIFIQNAMVTLFEIDSDNNEKLLINRVLEIDSYHKSKLYDRILENPKLMDFTGSTLFGSIFKLLVKVRNLMKEARQENYTTFFILIFKIQEVHMKNIKLNGFISDIDYNQYNIRNIDSIENKYKGNKKQKTGDDSSKDHIRDSVEFVLNQNKKKRDNKKGISKQKTEDNNLSDVLDFLNKAEDKKLNKDSHKQTAEPRDENLNKTEDKKLNKDSHKQTAEPRDENLNKTIKEINEFIDNLKKQEDKLDEDKPKDEATDNSKNLNNVKRNKKSYTRNMKALLKKLDEVNRNNKMKVKIELKKGKNSEKDNGRSKRKTINLEDFMKNFETNNKYEGYKKVISKIVAYLSISLFAIVVVHLFFLLFKTPKIIEITENEIEGMIKIKTIKNIDITKNFNDEYVASISNDSSTICNYKIGNIHKFLKWVEDLQRENGYTEKEFIKIKLERLVNSEYSSDVRNYIYALILAGVFLFLKKQISQGLKMKTKPMKSHEHKKKVDITFKDVAGMEEVKEEMYEFVEFLKNPEKFKKLGAKMPRGALLTGPPGTGKTYLAKAVAGESGIPFFYMSGSEFVEMFVGVGASRVRDLFKEARKKSPSIIFIDEIDAVAKKRDTGISHDEMESTLNQLLVEMDGFGTDTNVVVMAATNLKETLDPAIMRPGRFDRTIEVSLPSIKEREEIFMIYLKKLKLDSSKSIEFYGKRLATLTPGFTPADISNICNEAALIAARANAESINEIHFERATEKVIAGIEVKSASFEEQKEIIAIHECGHAIASWFLPGGSPLLKLVIKPRSKGALGFAQYLPSETNIHTKEELMDQIVGILGGRCAEMLFFGKLSTGAYDDLQKAQKIAFDLVTSYGMSENMKYIKFEYDEYGNKKFSEKTHALIDKEIARIINDQTKRCHLIIEEKKDNIRKLADKLLEKEILVFNDIVEILGDRPFDPHENFRRFLEEVGKIKRFEKKEPILLFKILIYNRMPRNRFSQQLTLWDEDPFSEMRRMREKMMQPFGRSLFDDDDFFSTFERQISRNFDEFDMNNLGSSGQYAMQSYTTKTVIGPDGRPITEKNVKKESSTLGKDGKRIVERDDIYKHSGKNIKKVEKERQLGDQRIKVTREARNNERNEYRDLENMDEDDVEHFNRRFNKYAEETGLNRFNRIEYKKDRRPKNKEIKAIRYH